MTNSRSVPRPAVTKRGVRGGLVLAFGLVVAFGGVATTAMVQDRPRERGGALAPARSRRTSIPARATLERGVRPVRAAAHRGRGDSPAAVSGAVIARRRFAGAPAAAGATGGRPVPWWCGRAAGRAPPAARVV